MRKVICLLLALLMSCLFVLPVMAAPEGPVITLQPQSPNYPNYSVAIYTVKAEGTNLHAYWYMLWQGKTYTISDIGGAMQDWEPYAGETYGARKLDDNTFAFIFEGIERDLDGAYIWCVIEDGHYDVSSQKARICVGNPNTPPEIVSIPAQLTVQQGDSAEIRCVAKSPDDSQLSFLWYETDTGRLEDIRAVNRGTETADYIFCDTSSPGTRNYICMVETSNGGLAYSSTVAVTVMEKTVVPHEPAETKDAEPPVTETTAEQPAPPAPTEVIPDTTIPAESKQDVTVSTQTDSLDTPEPTQTPDSAQLHTKDKEDPNASNNGLPWWILVLIGVAAAGIGVSTAIVLVKKKP